MPAAYQDENGKWYKQCSTTKQVFGPVDNKEDLSKWFSKNKNELDGFGYLCKQVHNQKNRKYYRENPDKMKEKEKRYYKQNAHKIKESKKQCNLSYNQIPARLLKNHKSSAKKRNINFTLTLQWYEQQITKPEFNICAISGKQFVDSNNNHNEPFARSLDRIDSTKGYTPDNVAWVCMRYNLCKSNLSHEEVKMIYEYSSKHNFVSSTT